MNYKTVKNKIKRFKEKKIYEGHKRTYDFARFKTLQSYGNDIKNGIIMKIMANNK